MCVHGFMMMRNRICKRDFCKLAYDTIGDHHQRICSQNILNEYLVQSHKIEDANHESTWGQNKRKTLQPWALTPLMSNLIITHTFMVGILNFKPYNAYATQTYVSNLKEWPHKTHTFYCLYWFLSCMLIYLRYKCSYGL